MNRLIIAMITLLANSAGYYSYGQVEKGFEVLEMVKIVQTNRLASNLEYSITYEYADDADPGKVLESMSGKYKFQDGKYFVTLGETDFIQGYMYSIAVYNEDSTIVVNERSSQDKLMQLPVLDSFFRQANMDSIRGVSVNDSINRLQIYFKPASYYAGYEITYNKNTYVVDKIVYRLRENAEHEDNPTPSGIARVTMVFSGYNYGPIIPGTFNEDNYVYRAEKTFIARAPYTNYQVIVNVGNQ